MLTHLQAKAMVDALPGVTRVASLFVRAVAWHETNYGAGWKPGEGAGSWNMGAITTAHPDALSFKHADSKFDPKAGRVVEYTTWFAGDVDARAGFARLAKLVLKPNVVAALATNDVLQGVAGMYENGYFLGLHTHQNVEGDKLNIEDYYSAVAKAIATIGRETGERHPEVTPPTGAAA